MLTQSLAFSAGHMESAAPLWSQQWDGVSTKASKILGCISTIASRSQGMVLFHSAVTRPHMENSVNF